MTEAHRRNSDWNLYIPAWTLTTSVPSIDGSTSSLPQIQLPVTKMVVNGHCVSCENWFRIHEGAQVNKKKGPSDDSLKYGFSKDDIAHPFFPLSLWRDLYVGASSWNINQTQRLRRKSKK